MARGLRPWSVAYPPMESDLHHPSPAGRVAHYSLTPRGDVDGLILDSGAEVHLSPPAGSPQPMSTAGTIRSQLHGRRGDLNGMPLADGTIIRDDANSVGAWPEKDIPGGQLGPNRNGHHW